MSEQKTDYGEVFCKAVDTILANRLDKLEFDVTKVCYITDNTYKKQGKYTVTDNSVQFEAYSTIYDLAVNDSVLVSIPNSNYNGQKTILNKVVSDDITQTGYKTPLANLLKFTDNQLKQYADQEYSILANDESTVNDQKTGRVVEIATITWDQDQSSDNAYIPYKRMGVGADFRAWLNSFRTTQGTYGLRFEFFIIDTDNNKKVAHSFDFNVKDMIGNPYNFDTYVHQEKTFDISRIQNANELKIFLYQNSDFINQDGQFIPYKSEGDPIAGVQSDILNDNIFVTNLELYFGYGLGEYTKDTLEISVSPNMSYSKVQTENKEKIMTLHWIHKIDDDNFEILDKESLASKVYEIYWCRYEIGANESKLIRSWIGDNWTKEFEINTKYGTDNPFVQVFIPNETKQEEKIKVVCRLMDDNGEWKQYNSDIITFTNASYVPDATTVNQIIGLSLVCDDGADGNYFIYNQSGEIINAGQGQGYKRLLKAQFNGLDLATAKANEELTNIQKIIWEFPRDNEDSKTGTMLTYKKSYFEDGELTKLDNTYRIERIVTEETDLFSFSTLAFSIKNNWHESNSFNRISCKLVANYTTYERTIELKFGKAGTSGTNITLKLDYDDGENALIIDEQFNIVEPCKIKAALYDMSGKKISMSSTNISEGTWDWKWYHANDTSFQNYNFLGISDVDIVSGEFKTRQYEKQLTKAQNFDIIMEDKDVNDLLKNNYHVLEVTYTPSVKSQDTEESQEESPDDENIVSTALTAYLPIAIKMQNKCDYMEGTRTVLYGAQGTLEHNTYTDAYILCKEKIGEPNEELNNVTWNISWDNTINDSDGDGQEETIADNYRPTLAPLNKGNTSYVALKPSPMYIQGYNDRACVYAIDNELSMVLWSQPLLIIQSDYGFPMVNEWTGGTQVGDSVVMATAFSAGKKDKNNKFSGIVLGDMKTMFNNQHKNTGLFGLLNDKITFSLTDDGVASFGKLAGKFVDSNNLEELNNVLNGDATIGAIQLGGSSNVFYDKIRSTPMFDIDNGLLDMVDNSSGKGLVVSALGKYPSTTERSGEISTPFLEFKNGRGAASLLNFSTDQAFIQSANEKIKMDLLAEKMTFKKNDDNVLTIDTSAASPITLNNFTMGWDGGFTIGKFQVTGNGTVYYDGKELSALIAELAASKES